MYTIFEPSNNPDDNHYDWAIHEAHYNMSDVDIEKANCSSIPGGTFKE